MALNAKKRWITAVVRASRKIPTPKASLTEERGTAIVFLLSRTNEPLGGAYDENRAKQPANPEVQLNRPGPSYARVNRADASGSLDEVPRSRASRRAWPTPRTAGARPYGRPGSSPRWRWRANRPARAPGPGRSRGTA